MILVGGGDGDPENAYKTARTLLHHHINVTEGYPLVGSFNTNESPAAEDKETIKSIMDTADYLNS